MEKSWKFQGVGGSTMKPLGMEKPGGWGVKLEKTLRGGGGGDMDIFWNLTIPNHCKRCDLLCNHGSGDLFTCKDNMLFSLVKVSWFRVKVHLVFHLYLYNKMM